MSPHVSRLWKNHRLVCLVYSPLSLKEYLSMAGNNQERKANRAAELKKSKAKKEEVAEELARLDHESKEEEKRVEVRVLVSRRVASISLA